ncbi:MAG: tetratricopeptide repeat protein [Terriglobia bacterium]
MRSLGTLSLLMLSLAALSSPHSSPGIAETIQLASREIRAGNYASAQKALREVLVRDPASAEANNLLGVCQAAAGSYAAAQKSFEESIRLRSGFSPAYVNLGNLLLKMHQEGGALKQFEIAINFDPGALTRNARPYAGFNLLGLCYTDEHKYAQARLAYEHSIRINPQYWPAYVNLGNELVALKQDSEALKQFAIALRIQPADPIALSNMGLIFARQEKFEQAAKYLRQAHAVASGNNAVTAALAGADIHCGQSLEAEALIEQLREEGSLDSRMRESLAATWLQKGKFARAVQLVQDQPKLAADFYRLGYLKAEALFETNQNQEAAELLESVRNLQAPNATFYGLLGSIYYALDEPKKASEDFQQAIRMDPSDPDYYFKLGMVFLKHHTPETATYIFHTALNSQPKSPKLWLGLGISYYFASNMSEGEHALRSAIALDPNYEIAYIVLGDLLDTTGRPGEAADIFKKAIELRPDSFVPYYYYGVAASRLGQGKLAAAVVTLRKAALLNPGFAEAHYELGKSLAEEGQFPEAIAELNKSLRLEPNLSRSHYQLGRVYEKLGNKARAQEEFHLFATASEKKNSNDLVLHRLIVQIGAR